MEARHDKKPKKYPGFQVKRGELVTSLSIISQNNEYFRHTVKKWSRQKVSRMLEKLSEEGRIEILSDTYGTHIKITNYETYQDPGLYVSDSNGTVAEQKRTEVGINNNDNDGTFNGNAFVNTSSDLKNGSYGGALDLDGTGDYVDVGVRI